MSEGTKTTMKPEEAIVEISSLQVKHNLEIQKLQENLKAIQEKLSSHMDEINQKMEKELIIVNDKLTSHITSTHTEMNSQMNRIKQEMPELIEENLQKIHVETKANTDQNAIQWAALIKEIKAVKHGLVEVKEARSNEEREQQEEHISSAPITTNDACSVHSNQSELNNNRIQTILLPAPTSAPLFHGKSTERPGQFLIRVEEYTETVHMWGEDLLLRGISQFLKDNALEWYCQLRSCNYLPKTWTEFKQTFIKQFNSPVRIAQHKQQWKECWQGRDETINEFIIRLRALWVEQYPEEKESDLVKHLLCKMRPDILNVVGYPRNANLQEIITEAQRIEEILYYRAKNSTQTKKSFNNTNYTYNNQMNNSKEYSQVLTGTRFEQQSQQMHKQKRH